MVEPTPPGPADRPGPWALWADDFGWSEDIGVLAILDGTRLRDDRAASGSRRYAGRSSRSCTWSPASASCCIARLGLGWPLWVDAPSFDLANHVQVQLLPAGR